MAAPVLECCTPWKAPYPSGWAWTHSKWCSLPSMRNQKVRIHTTHPAGTGFIDQKQASAFTPLRVWFSHDHDVDGTPMCEPCAYVESHLDDDDDRTLEAVRRA